MLLHAYSGSYKVWEKGSKLYMSAAFTPYDLEVNFCFSSEKQNTQNNIQSFICQSQILDSL